LYSVPPKINHGEQLHIGTNKIFEQLEFHYYAYEDIEQFFVGSKASSEICANGDALVSKNKQ